MTRYFFVPVADFQDYMLNRATVSDYVITLVDTIDYYVLEAPLAELKITSMFDIYVWYTRDEMLSIVGPVMGQGV